MHTYIHAVTLIKPFMGAIAAGCCAVVKPSEQTPRTAAALAKYIPQYLDKSCYRCEMCICMHMYVCVYVYICVCVCGCHICRRSCKIHTTVSG